MNIEGFELIERLGRTPESEVWKAKHLALDRIVALRVLDEETLDRARVSAIVEGLSAAAQLKHPHLVAVYDIGRHGRRTCVVMEYVAGGTVEQLVERDGPLPNATALRIVQAAALALDTAWREAGIVHGNITPANLMLDETGVIKLADLGLPPASPRDADAGASHPGLKAPHFKSPEHALAPSTDTPQSDMYCLGAVLYYLLTGQRPFDGHLPEDTAALHVRGFLTSPRELQPKTPPMTVKLLSQMLAKQPEDRWEDWASAITEIEAVAAGRLLIKKGPSNPVSSIDRRTPETAASRHPRRRATDRKRSGSVPRAVRVPAWLLLFAFWCFLGYRQFTWPLVRFDWRSTVARSGSRAVRRHAPSPAATRAPASPVPAGERDTRPAAALAPPSVPAPPAAPAPPALSNAERAALERAKQQAAAALLAGDDVAARAAVESVGPASPSPALRAARTALRLFLDRLANIDRQVADAFRTRIGSELIVDMHGVSRRIIPRSVSGQTIEADLIRGGSADRETTPVSFRAAELTPDEKLRWIAPRDPEVTQALKLLLLARAGRLTEARALASGCGPLAKAFADQL